jgi:hypothetical protein
MKVFASREEGGINLSRVACARASDADNSLQNDVPVGDSPQCLANIVMPTPLWRQAILIR